jgi:prepilin-type N-terminal cleavage/methylation domain-containing protein
MNRLTPNHEPFVVQALACWCALQQPEGWTTNHGFRESLWCFFDLPRAHESHGLGRRDSVLDGGSPRPLPFSQWNYLPQKSTYKQAPAHSQSGRGLPPSKTWRKFVWFMGSREAKSQAERQLSPTTDKFIAGAVPTTDKFIAGANSKRGGSFIHASAGFTLLEMLLAIVIASTILAVALFFYQQATDLRAQLLQETERISAIRLVLDRLTADLRSAFPQASLENALTGSATSMQLVKADVPSRSVWNPGPFGRLISPESDLRLVTYSMASSGEGTNVTVTGLNRIEKPLVGSRTLPLNLANEEVMPTTNQVAALPPPLIEEIRFLRFRYYDGSAWQDSWSKSELPMGVEVSLGWEPLPEDGTPDEYPYELFRRVVYLPASHATTNEVESIPSSLDNALTGNEAL